MKLEVREETGRHRGAEPVTRPPESQPRQASSWRNRLATCDLKSTPYLMVLPFFVLFGVFGLYPLVYTFWVSLHDWHLINGDQGFVGLDNYTALFNTFSLFILSTVPQLLIALGLAALLNSRLRARTFFRAGVLIPNVVTVVAVGLVLAQIFG